MDIKFPKPQYLGAKYIHGEWITRHIPECAQVVLDAFSGSQSISFLCKQLGKKVITNDFLKFNSEIGKALIENKNEILMPEDISILFSDNSDPKEYNLMEQLFTNIFFVREETKFLDAFRSNIDRLKNKYKKALAFTIMNRALTRKVTMGHFAHTQALVYAANPDRIKRNRSLIRPIKDIFSELISEYNNAVFDNGCECISCNEDIIKFLPTLSNIDLAYFDPPYCNSHADYQGFYHLLETYTNYWKDKEFINGTKRYSPKKEIIGSFKKLFSLSKDIPYWLISYNDRSYPDIQTLVDLIRPYRKVSIDRKLYQTGRGGKGSVAGSNEILLVCEP
ncbi:DNA adenine methylase [uncultured Muribaculum sp.]|uniref:DNA adenine methylase n=1 Tax=uncultured Muribaculum sp. TaxID=1918613 RepID=UPI0026472454|nr:DNA adenine methylase [uncultured Muribaculum sp.]